MRLQKTSGEPMRADGPTPPVRNPPSRPEIPQIKTPVSQTARPPAGPPTAASHSAASPAATAGLPADRLSASVVSFARFFSLPLKPELLAAIRRQAAGPPAASQTASAELPAQPGLAKTAPMVPPAQAGRDAGIQEAFSLAAAAAESKGVKLSPEGLEAFAAAINPDRRERQDSGERGRRERRDKNPEHPAGGDRENTPLSGSGLRETALESSEKPPLLALINRLPGKNGQHWIVLPFRYKGYGRELQVSMRVLLEGGPPPEAGRVRQMVLDIAAAVSAGGEGEHAPEGPAPWGLLFSLNAANGNEPPKLTVYLEDGPPASAYVGELSRHTGIPPDCITVKNRRKKFPCESAPGDDLLLSVNESV